MTQRRFRRSVKVAAIIVAIISSGVGLSLRSHTASAVSATDFQPGHIIDDAVFYNSGAFPNAQAVQDFITNHTPACDTWGTQPSGYGNLTRAQWAQQVMGWPGPPYVCLQNYYENPDTGATSYENGGGAFAGGVSAGQIIYDAARQYGINPEVLLVFLKKESPGPLFSDSWPLKSQYRYAMGYACPDSGPNYSAACVDSKAGFYKQVTLAAWQLRYYADHIGDYNYQPGRWNYIQYSPDPNCGGQNVYIDNLATASLYIYTPYVPNQAALQAYPGTASCGAYGNRNFFMFFNEWFGSTYGAVNITTPLTVKSDFSQGLFTNKTITAQFTIRNNSGQRQDIGTMAIAVRDQNNTNYDFGSQHIILDPWQTYTYQATRTLSNEGQYSFSIVNYRDGAGWSSTYPDSLNASYPRSVNNAIVENMPTVTSAPAFDNGVLHVGQSTTVRMTITNNSSLYPVNLGYFGLAMASPSGRNADMLFDTVTSLAPGATYNYAKPFTPTEAGNYKARVSSTGDGGVTWSETLYPAAINPATNRTNITVKSNPTLTQGLTVAPTTLYAGDTTTGTFKVKNFSDTAVVVNKSLCYIVRGPNNTNNDLGCLAIGTLLPGQELTYTGSRALNVAGQYTAFFSMYDGSWHDGWSFEQETGTEPTKMNFTVKSNPLLLQGLTIDNATPRVGDTVTGSFQVKNNSAQAVTVNKSLCYIVRGPNNTNYDFGCLPITTMTAGQTLTFSASRKINTPGQYNGFFAMYDGTYWYNNSTFDKTIGTEPTTIGFIAKGTPTLTQGLTISSATPATGSTVTGAFKVKNNSASDVVVNKKLCYIVRGPSNGNYDLGCLDIGTISAGQELTFSGSRTVSAAGQYNGFFAMYDGTYWYNNWTFDKEIGTEPTAVNFTAQ